MAGSPVHPGLVPLPTLFLALALLLTPSTAAAAPGTDLAAAVTTASGQLRQAWASDPGTAALPFPKVRLLPDGASVDSSCNPGAQQRRPAPTAAWCASNAEVLLDRDLLSSATAKASDAQQQMVVSYWLATALGERLLPGPPEGAPPRALATLQANCLGGMLLGASTARPKADANPLLITVRAAYGDSYSAVVGSPSQRAYAVLTGLGATATPECSSQAMAELAQDIVPDLALLAEIRKLPPPDRAHSSLMSAINSQCQPLPKRPCPRRIANK